MDPDRTVTPSGSPEAEITPRASAKRSDYGPSIIGASLVMRGELSLDEDLIIEGTFEGSRIEGAKNLSIGTFAHVRASVWSDTADIAGELEGDVQGSGTIFVRRTARISGIISSRELRVEDGTNLEHAVLCGCIGRAETR